MSFLGARSRVLVSLALLLFAVCLRADAQAIGRVDSIGIAVSDMDRSLAFYTQVLGFERVGGREATGESWERLYGVFGLRVRIERLRLGSEFIELLEFETPRGRPLPVDTRSNDLWFQHVAIIVSDMDKAYAELRRHGVRHASTAPQRLPDWNPNAGGIEAFYFRDPDGNHLEILRFPPGKGEPRWQQGGGRLFLGIDHTAIVIADTDASLRFYRDVLGLVVAGQSENYGIEQERLNNVFGARLKITAMRAASGPGIEFLEYLAPRNGRSMPTDTRPNDLWHWQVNVGADVASVDAALRRGHYPFVSAAPVAVTDGGGLSLIARDPDGHAIQFNQPLSAAR
jgi:catechol 2,3-dioxygenase-like lactoylglutathione lyase family enzyme